MRTGSRPEAETQARFKEGSSPGSPREAARERVHHLQGACCTGPKCAPHLCRLDAIRSELLQDCTTFPRWERGSYRGVLPSAWGPVGSLCRVSSSRSKRRRVSSRRRGDVCRSTRGTFWSARWAPAAVSAAPKQPPLAPSTPHNPPGLYYRHGALSRDLWRPPTERQLRGGEKSSRL